MVRFSVVELATSELAGEAVVWSIDLHNRSAHLGLSLRPAFRGRHLGTDLVRVLVRYGFALRGLYRLQIETLADNHAMIGAALRAGFVPRGHPPPVRLGRRRLRRRRGPRPAAPRMVG